MADINANYIGTFNGTATYGVTAYSIEKILKRDFEDTFFDAEPLLDMIKDGGAGFNKGGKVNGTKLILPVLMQGPTSPAAGVSDANNFSAATFEHNIGLSQAEYEFTHYRKVVSWANYENVLGKGEAALRGDVLQGILLQTVKSFRAVMSTDLMGTTIGSRTVLQGVRQVLSESNTVGNISQSTYTNWAAKVTTGIGTFSADAVIDLYDEATRDKQAPNLLLAAYASSNNVFGKVRGLLSPAEMIVNNNGGSVKYGINEFYYLGMKCVKDDAGTSGEILLLNTDTWYYVGHTVPQLVDKNFIQGTDSQYMTYNMWACVGCDNPRLNARGTGIT